MDREEFKSTVVSELNISVSMINDQLETQAARYAHYASLYAEAAKRARDFKLRAETVQAQLAIAAKQQLEAMGEKAYEFRVTSLVESDQRRTQAWQDYNEAQYQADLLDVAKQGFSQRKDLLVTIAANLRAEFGGQVRINQSSGNSTSEQPRKDLGSLMSQFKDQQR